MIILALIPYFFAGIVIGSIWGKRTTNKLWKISATEEYRPAICCDGEFFYVLPEAEYVATQIKAQRFDQMEEK